MSGLCTRLDRRLSAGLRSARLRAFPDHALLLGQPNEVLPDHVGPCDPCARAGLVEQRDLGGVDSAVDLRFTALVACTLSDCGIFRTEGDVRRPDRLSGLRTCALLRCVGFLWAQDVQGFAPLSSNVKTGLLTRMS